jgi:hypothetical protein
MDYTALLKIIGIVAAVLVGSGGFLLLIKKTSSAYVSAALAIVSFVKTTLENCGLETAEMKLAFDWIIQALDVIQAESSSSTTTDQKVTDAFDFIQTIATAAGVTLSDTEITVIKAVLKLGFIFMGDIGITTSSLSHSKAKRFYKTMSKQATKHLGMSKDLPKVGLRKEIA